MSVTLLFDDVEENRTEIKAAFNSSDGATLDFFDDSRELPDSYSYERHIEEQLRETTERIPIRLIACDKELGEYKNYRGLSANAISSVARTLGIPFCQYSRNFGPAERELERFTHLRRWNSEDITLEEDTTEAWGAQIRGFLSGFEMIRNAYADDAIQKLKPARALANIMGRSETATKLSLYGAGDQSVMTEIFAFLGSEVEAHDMVDRMPRILGTWLWLSILRFPGVLVNSGAASSLLNVDEEDFKRPEVRSMFDATVYEGPFSVLGEWWWREDLEGMVLDAAADDGQSYLKNQGLAVSPCLDNQSGERAGYYCMITNSPVSHANSVGNINWFPAGADLARIQKEKFQEITSLINI